MGSQKPAAIRDTGPVLCLYYQALSGPRQPTGNTILHLKYGFDRLKASGVRPSFWVISGASEIIDLCSLRISGQPCARLATRWSWMTARSMARFLPSRASGRMLRPWRLAVKSWRACSRDGCWSALPITPGFRISTAIAWRSGKLKYNPPEYAPIRAYVLVNDDTSGLLGLPFAMPST